VGGGMIGIVVAGTIAHVIKHTITTGVVTRILRLRGGSVASLYVGFLSVATLAVAGGFIGLWLGASSPVAQVTIGVVAAGVLLSGAAVLFPGLGLREELPALRSAFRAEAP
jgi:hypothetical protein